MQEKSVIRKGCLNEGIFLMTKDRLEMFDALKWKMDCMTILFGKKRLTQKAFFHIPKKLRFYQNHNGYNIFRYELQYQLGRGVYGFR